MVSVKGASAIASDPRYISPSPWPTASADHEIVVALEQEGQCKRAAQMRQRRFHCGLRRIAFLQVGLDEMDHHLGVGLCRKLRAFPFQLSAQLAEILDDA